MFTLYTLQAQVHNVNIARMEREKDSYHHGNLRDALLAQAFVLIEKAGAEGFSLREAARMVGVSANAAYRHFPDKSGLLTAVAVAGFVRLAARMEKEKRKISADGTSKSELAVARFRALGIAYVEFALQHAEVFRVMFGVSGLCCFEDQLGQVPEPTPFSLLGAGLDELVAAGVLTAKHRQGAELKAWPVVHGFASLALEGAGPFRQAASRTAALHALIDFTLRGLGA
jgi:AcrR family transcriptional regulator